MSDGSSGGSGVGRSVRASASGSAIFEYLPEFASASISLRYNCDYRFGELGKHAQEVLPVKVKDAMAKTVTSAKKDDKVIDVAKKMRQEDAGFMPVVQNGGTVIGVITDRDIVIRCIAEGHDPRGETAEHVMSTEISFISPDDDI